ncbi:MAG: substrate-binding domain-containing protein [Actinomycetota bacterium]|nr:substrate-binding domain-containing protein [Actinomycetota bacterium]
MSTIEVARRRGTRIAIALVAALALSACGSDDDATDTADADGQAAGAEQTTTTPDETTGGDADGDAPGSTDDGSDDATDGGDGPSPYDGVVAEPPAEAPEPVADQSVWVVSCGEQVVTCSTPSEAVVEASEAVGWSAQICDGQLNPQGWSDCIRQGASSGGDAIVTIGVDCVAVSAALAEAAAAGITTINVGATDCDIVGEDPLYSGVVPKLEGLTAEEWWGQMGALQADWVIEQTGGEARVLLLEFTDPLWGPWLATGFADRLATCDGCEIAATLEVTNQDVTGGSLVTRFSTTLVEQADANAVVVPIDGWFLAGLAQAIGESGRSDELAVIGQGGTAANFDLIREDRGQDATVAFSLGWDGWSGIDALVRVLAGEEVVAGGVGHQVVDADHNLPEPGDAFRYVPEVAFEDAYLAAWGVS